jgi:hypothetical protein
VCYEHPISRLYFNGSISLCKVVQKIATKADYFYQFSPTGQVVIIGDLDLSKELGKDGQFKQSSFAVCPYSISDGTVLASGDTTRKSDEQERRARETSKRDEQERRTRETNKRDEQE